MNSLKKTYKKIINNPTVDEPYYHIFTKYISAYSTAILSKTPITPKPAPGPRPAAVCM